MTSRPSCGYYPVNTGSSRSFVLVTRVTWGDDGRPVVSDRVY
ncbi:hypothetical protein [Arthrobacter sp. 24S4-2]|nr:hypothetical protein [Arthrobacter sp. 24S4-2]